VTQYKLLSQRNKFYQK